jgi:hypothetical protein
MRLILNEAEVFEERGCFATFDFLYPAKPANLKQQKTALFKAAFCLLYRVLSESCMKINENL